MCLASTFLDVNFLLQVAQGKFCSMPSVEWSFMWFFRMFRRVKVILHFVHFWKMGLLLQK